MKISTSFLKSKYSLRETISKLESSKTDYIHVDIMDGKFVNNTSFSIDDIRNNLFVSIKPLDIHLMVENPLPYIEAFKRLNVKNITIHAEIDKDINELLKLIKSYGIGAGIAINPETKIENIKTYLPFIDYIIIMGVTPGAGGQKLIPETVDKAKYLIDERNKNNYRYEISIDGGVNADTYKMLFNYDVLISGSFICTSDNYDEKITILKN